MDYIYSTINDSIINNPFTWETFVSLPEASEEYFMHCAVVQLTGVDYVYICLREGNNYVWKLLVDANPISEGE